jgi:hypothetical protein
MCSGSRVKLMVFNRKNEVLSSEKTRFWNENSEVTATQLGPTLRSLSDAQGRFRVTAVLLAATETFGLPLVLQGCVRGAHRFQPCDARNARMRLSLPSE